MKNILRYVYAILAVPFIIALRFVLMPLIGPGIPYITLFPVSVAIALLAGLGPAILTGILGSIAIDFYFIPPLYALELTIEGLSRMAIVTLTSAFVGYVGDRLRTARSKAEQQAVLLHTSEERYHSLFEDALTGDFIASPDGRILVCNPAYVKMLGFSNDEEITNSNLKEVHFDPEEYNKFINLIHEKHSLHRYECFLRRRDGVKIHVVENIVGTFDQHGSLLHFKGYLFDDTVRKDREGELQKLNRTLKAMSNSGQIMMRANEESTYLTEVCKIIVEDCGYAMVWIGFAENDEYKTVRPAAYAGFEKGYLEGLRISWSDIERGRGPTGTAIRTGKPCLCRDMLTDPDFGPWRDEAIKRGYASSIVLPLITEKNVFGAVTIYSKEQNAFSRDEEKLLTELTNDLAYGITSLRIQAARDEAAKAIQASEERFKFITSNTPDHILIQDRDLRYSLVVNPQLGLTEKDMLGKTDYDILTTNEADNITKIKRYVIETDVSVHMEMSLLDKEGKQQYFDGSYIPQHNMQGEVNGLIGYFKNITARKLAEEELKKAHDELEQKVIERTAALVKSTERLRFTMDNMNEGCMIIDSHWTYLYVNESAARHGHQKCENLLGRTMMEIYPGIEETEVFSNYWRALNEHIPVRFESSFTFPDGITNWFDFSVEPVPEGIFVLSIDITERRKLTESLERNHRELLTFYRLSEIFLSSRSLEELFDDIVDEICAATGFPIAGIGIYDDSTKRIVIRGQRSRAGQAERPALEIPVDGTPSGEVVRTGKPVIETHLLERSKYQRTGLRQTHVQSFVGYPMKIGEKIIGSLNLLHTENIEISDEMNQWIGSLANYVAVLTYRKRTEEELHVSREQLQELSNYTQSAIEAERKRIAREIHDELGQQLSLLQLELGMMENKLPRSEKDLRNKSKSMTKLIDATIRTVQRISTDLRPTLLDDLGLGAAVEWEVQEFQKRTKIKCHIVVEPSDMMMDQDRSIALFRILQETLTNILRHSKATRVRVQLAEQNHTIVLRVQDNGIGISQQQITDTKSIGLTGIRERIRPWEGSVSITGQAGKGTEITVTIPTKP